MRCVIVAIIRGEIEELYKIIADDISKKFSIQNVANRIQCHMTLKYPFECNDDEVGKIEKKIQEVANSTKISEFKTSKFGSFDRKTIYFFVEDNSELVKDLKLCVEKLGIFDEDRKFDSDNYHPHISVARNIPSDIFTNVWDYVVSQYEPVLRGKFDNISLLEEKDGVWVIRKIFDFSN